MSPARSTALLADIGGTNARFAILEDGELRCLTTLEVADFPAPQDAIRVFLEGPARAYRPVCAALAAAGPVFAGKVALTNASWVIDCAEIRRAFGLRSAVLVNDFEALAWSAAVLAPEDVRPLGSGAPLERAPLAVIGPGTGFGVAALVCAGEEKTVVVTEGGHASLAGNDRREDAIIQLIRDDVGHVSVESVLSGEGMVRLHQAMAVVDGTAAPQTTAADIVTHALAGDCPASRATLELFCAFLGSAAGNIALTLGARGGVYIAGGIVPRFIDFLSRSAFRRRFEAKGRMSAYLAAIPTAAVVHPQPAFLGLARLAQWQLAG